MGLKGFGQLVTYEKGVREGVHCGWLERNVAPPPSRTDANALSG